MLPTALPLYPLPPKRDGPGGRSRRGQRVLAAGWVADVHGPYPEAMRTPQRSAPCFEVCFQGAQGFPTVFSAAQARLQDAPEPRCAQLLLINSTRAAAVMLQLVCHVPGHATRTLPCHCHLATNVLRVPCRPAPPPMLSSWCGTVRTLTHMVGRRMGSACLDGMPSVLDLCKAMLLIISAGFQRDFLQLQYIYPPVDSLLQGYIPTHNPETRPSGSRDVHTEQPA